MAKGKLNEHKAAPLIITDFETGGVDLSKHAISEIAMLAIKGDTLEEIGRYESLIKPYGKEYDPKAIEKTGLTEAKLEKEGKDFKVVFKEVHEFLQSANIHNSKTQHKPILVAHNATFENQCFQHLYCENKAEAELEKVLQGQWDYHQHYGLKFIDTLELSRMLWAANVRMQSFGLESTCERAGLEVSDGHRAINDVLPTNEFLKWFIKLARAAESGKVTGNETDKQLSFRSNFHFQY